MSVRSVESDGSRADLAAIASRRTGSVVVEVIGCGGDPASREVRKAS
jgi:hypothetical protein